MKLKTGLVVGSLLLGACTKEQPKVEKPTAPDNQAWMDTVRHYDTKLSEEQRQLVFYHRNHEENYQLLQDTSRVALRFVWWRAFGPLVIIRLENRPQYSDSAGIRKKHEEWFATYKEAMLQLNNECPVEQDGRCSGKVAPFVYQQRVEILPVNQTPALLAGLDSIDFWKMKASYPAPPHVDGSSWTLQVYQKGRYKEVTTDLREHPLKSICLRMIELSKYPIEKEEIN